MSTPYLALPQRFHLMLGTANSQFVSGLVGGRQNGALTVAEYDSESGIRAAYTLHRALYGQQHVNAHSKAAPDGLSDIERLLKKGFARNNICDVLQLGQFSNHEWHKGSKLGDRKHICC